MTPKQYHDEVRRTSPGDNDLVLGALGLAGEAGEVGDAIKKHRYHGHELDREHLVKELGDVLWYLTYLCNALDATLSEVMDANAAKLRKRYPTGWSSVDSKARVDVVADGQL